MAEMSFGSQSASGSPVSTTASTAAKQSKRTAYLRDADGNLVGNNWTVPKGDFAHFLGYADATPNELAGQTPVSSRRVLELVLRKQFQQIGEGAAQNGNRYRNMSVATGRFDNEPGRENDMIKNGIDAIQQGSEPNTAHEEMGRLGSMGSAQYLEMLQKYSEASRNDNTRYLEMQYKFNNLSRQTETISNLLKVRSDAVSRTVRGGASG